MSTHKTELLIGVGLALLLFALLRGVNVLPLLLTGGLLYAVYHNTAVRQGGRTTLANGPTAAPPQVAFADIGGLEATKRELVEALDFLLTRDEVKRLGIAPLKGLLLTGPPGTGKTLLAKAAAHYTDAIFVTAAGSDFVEMYAGVGAQRVRQLFRTARETAKKEKKARAIIFIDEIEVVGAKRGQHTGHLEYDQTINALLTEMDGILVDDEVQVLVMAATNRVDLLDDALVRPGRFDRIVQVDLPSLAGRQQILTIHTKNKPLDPSVDLGQVARQTFGFSGAHLASLANEAAILALRDGAPTLTQPHFTAAIDKVLLGEVADRRPTEAEKRRVAIHEAGHALVGEWVSPGSVASVTITPRGQAMGYVRSHEQEDRYVYTLPELQGKLRVCLAGAIAEELALGGRSTGAANDFEKAADLTRKIVAMGLSSLGIVDFENLDKGQLHAEQQRLLNEEQAATVDYLSQHLDQLKAVGEQLFAEEVINGADLRSLLCPAPSAPLTPVRRYRLTAPSH